MAGPNKEEHLVELVVAKEGGIKSEKH